MNRFQSLIRIIKAYKIQTHKGPALVGGFLFALILFQLIQGLPDPNPGFSFLLEFRVSRLLAAIAAGIILSCAGAACQTLFSNALAEPYTLGISASSAIGAVIAISLIQDTPLTRVIGALLGAWITTITLWRFVRRTGASSTTTLLLGLLISHFAAATMTVWISVASAHQTHSLANWLMGDCSRVRPNQSFILIGVAFLFFGWSLFRAKKLDGFLFGEKSAEGFGVDSKRILAEAILMISLAVGATVALMGAIGFVGLMVPHFARRFSGPRHLPLMIYSATFGSVLILFADSISRWMGTFSSEIPVAAMTAILGIPFLFLVISKKVISGVRE